MERDWRLGLKRGLARHCPNCGEGSLFAGYLKVKPTCNRCGHSNGRYRPDDAAPYFTVLLVGHLVIAPVLTFDVIQTWPLALLMAALVPSIVLVTLLALPWIKGAVLGVLWATHQETTRAAPTAGEP